MYVLTEFLNLNYWDAPAALLYLLSSSLTTPPQGESCSFWSQMDQDITPNAFFPFTLGNAERQRAAKAASEAWTWQQQGSNAAVPCGRCSSAKVRSREARTTRPAQTDWANKTPAGKNEENGHGLYIWQKNPTPRCRVKQLNAL